MMFNLSLADFNGVVPWVGPVLGGTDTVTARGTPAVDQINGVGTFVGHEWGLSHGHAHCAQWSTAGSFVGDSRGRPPQRRRRLRVWRRPTTRRALFDQRQGDVHVGDGRVARGEARNLAAALASVLSTAKGC